MILKNIHAHIRNYLTVTVYVGTDQNFEIEIFADDKYTLNELLVKKEMFFITSNSLRDMKNESFYRKKNCMTCDVL